MIEDTIKRINELSKIARERELTPKEQKEREQVRQEYLNAIKRNFRQTLDSIEIKKQ